MTDFTLVKNMSSTDAGAPSINGNPGQMIALLDALLLNGYNTKSLLSITRVGDTCTATVSAGHGYRVDQVVGVSGADQVDYNGEWRVIAVPDDNTFKFKITGTPVTPATGTLSAKVAPLNWVKPFTGTNVAAYRSQDPTSNQLFLRIDDTGNTKADVCGLLSMTDITTGVGKFPNTSGGNASEPAGFSPSVFSLRWRKCNPGASLSTVNPWWLIGDGKTFYLLMAWNRAYSSSYQFGDEFQFGDIRSFRPNDAFGTSISGESTSGATNPSYPGQYSEGYLWNSGNVNYGFHLAMGYLGIGGYRDLKRFGLSPGPSGWYSGQRTSYAFPAPNGPDYSYILTPGYIGEYDDGGNFHARGIERGKYGILNKGAPSDGTVMMLDIAGMGQLRPMIIKKVAAQAGNNNDLAAAIAYDLYGPWG